MTVEVCSGVLFAGVPLVAGVVWLFSSLLKPYSGKSYLRHIYYVKMSFFEAPGTSEMEIKSRGANLGSRRVYLGVR